MLDVAKYILPEPVGMWACLGRTIRIRPWTDRPSVISFGMTWALSTWSCSRISCTSASWRWVTNMAARPWSNCWRRRPASECHSGMDNRMTLLTCPSSPPDFRSTFQQRALNAVSAFFHTWVNRAVYVPRHQSDGQALSYTVYPGHEDRPPLVDILRNVTLTLVNSHHGAVGSSVPMVPTLVNVAGMHCTPSGRLPEVRHSLCTVRNITGI